MPIFEFSVSELATERRKLLSLSSRTVLDDDWMEGVSNQAVYAAEFFEGNW